MVCYYRKRSVDVGRGIYEAIQNDGGWKEYSSRISINSSDDAFGGSVQAVLSNLVNCAENQCLHFVYKKLEKDPDQTE